MDHPKLRYPLSNLQARALVYGQKCGPCTIYDLRRALETPNIDGSVFRPGMWVRVGYVVAELRKSKGDSVAVWATKAWLDKHSVNGRNLAMSAFSFDRIYIETIRNNNNKLFNQEDAQWIIGTDNLSDDYRAKKTILGIPTKYCAGSTGAILVTNQKDRDQQPPTKLKRAACRKQVPRLQGTLTDAHCPEGQ
jgi:hypothetical protein